MIRDSFLELARELNDLENHKAEQARRAALPVVVGKRPKAAPPKPAASATLDGIMAKAMASLAAGEITATGVAQLEAQANQIRDELIARGRYR